MASHRSKSRYAIKECSTCRSLYTKECCSIGSLKNKILVPEPDSSPCCARCGTPVDDPSCRGCAFLQKKFDEDLLAYCVENGNFKDFQVTSEASDDYTNVVNALREPCVVNQDPGEKSSQEPPQIDHNCCYECGDSLDGIFCRQCICKSCGKGAHYGYNCPPKVPIISKSEQCNQTISELPQILPSVHPTCNYEVENSFAYDPNPNSFDKSPIFSYHLPQPQFETYLCELCGNNAHYGYDCPPQFPFVYEQEPCYNQNFNDNYYLQNSPSFSQYYLCCAYCGELAQDSVSIVKKALDKILEELEELQNESKNLKELKERDAKNKNLIKSSVENLVPIPSEFEGIFDDTCDVPNCDNNRVNVESDFVESLDNRDTSIVHSSKIDPIFEEFTDELAHIALIPPGIIEADFNPNDDTSSDDDSYEDIEYVDATPPNSELIEALNDNSTLSSFSNSDNSFRDHTEETRSGSTTTHANYSLPEYDSFLFEIEPNQEGLISIDN
ncbi:hypothetical protein Tco_0156581 [Tanacetum coccineum]